jgi:hypothetical protein
MPRRSSAARTGQAADAEQITANAFAKEVNVLLKLLAEKYAKYKQLSVELIKAAQEDVSTSFASMLKRRPSAKTGQSCYAEAIYAMLKVLANKSGKELMTNKEYKQLSVELAQTACDEIQNVMVSLANGKELMTTVGIKELTLATKDEIAKKGLTVAYEFSALPARVKALDRYIAGDESVITRVPKWPKNKDELFEVYNDTWDCFECAHAPRKVTRKEWKVARAQVRHGIFYPIEPPLDMAKYEAANHKVQLTPNFHLIGGGVTASYKAKAETKLLRKFIEAHIDESFKEWGTMTVKDMKIALQRTKDEMVKNGRVESFISTGGPKIEEMLDRIPEDTLIQELSDQLREDTLIQEHEDELARALLLIRV